MIGAALRAPRAAVGGGPLYQWDSGREAGPRALRLYGRLGSRELTRVLDAVVERSRGPQDSILVDFTEVVHVDYRAIADFLAALARWRDRHAAVWLVGVSPYVRQLMDVSGQGALRRALSWDAGPAGSAAPVGGDDLRSAERRALRAGLWN